MTRLSHKTTLRALLLASGLACTVSTLSAQLYWYPEVGSSTWQDGGPVNWNSNAGGTGTASAWNNAALNAATFSGTGSAVTVSGQVETSKLTINTDGYSLSGGTIIVNSGTSSAAFLAVPTSGTITISSALDFRRTTAGQLIVASQGANITFGAVTGLSSNFLNSLDFDQKGADARMDFNGLITATIARFGVAGNGTASYYLNAANTISSRTEISKGTVYLSSAGALGVGSVQLGNNNTLANHAAMLINGAFTFSNTVTLSNNTNVTTQQIMGGSSAHNSEFSGNVALRRSGTQVNNLGVTAAAGGRVDFSGELSGTGVEAFVTKLGAGTVRFTRGDGNTYEGGTIISAGTLLVMNTNSATSATGTGAVELKDGATLGGTGYVTGLVTTTGANGTAHFAPGDAGATGRLNLNGGLTVANGATFDIQMNGASVDQVNFGAGNLSLDGVIVFNLTTVVGGTVLTGTPYTIFLSTSGTPGTWALGGNVSFQFNTPVGYELDESYGTGGYVWDATGRSLSVQLVPEPTTWLLLSASGVAILLMRRKRAS